MKVTAITCLIGGLALAGIWPLAGFFSKDALLESALSAAMGISPANAGISPALAWVILVAAILTVLMTAFYTARMWSLVFLGKPRSHGAEHAHESPPAMLFALLVLTGLTIVAGWPFVKHLTGMQWAEHALPGWFTPWIWGLTAAATLTAVGGLLWGYKAYTPAPAAEPLKRLGPIYTSMVNLWYIDAFFRWLAGRVVLVMARSVAWFDKQVIDGILVDGSCWVTGRVGHLFRVSGAGPSPGQLQYYALVIVLVLAALVVGLTFGDYWAAAQGMLGR
jgi:NADH-quinone oxidoreductase subunit L